MKVAESSLAKLKFNFGMSTYLRSFLDLLIDLRSLTLRRFVNISREASSDQVKRVDQVLLFQNISTEMAGKTF